MTNDRIKSDSRTDCKPSALLSIIYDTNIHLLYCLRMQNKIKCFDGIFWNLHSSCKIITGSSRNISQDHMVKILYSVSHFIYCSVSAQNDQSLFFLVSRKHRCDRCRIFSSFRQINLIFYLTLFQFFMYLFPDCPSSLGAGIWIYNKTISHSRNLRI